MGVYPERGEDSGTVESACRKEESGRTNRPLCGRALLRYFGISRRQALENEGVSFIGELRHQGQVVSAEAAGVVKVLLYIQVAIRIAGSFTP